MNTEEMMEQAGHTSDEDRPTSTVGRNQNALYALPHDAASAAHFLAHALERVDRSTDELQLLIIASDPETAITLAQVASALETGRGARVIPATSARRAARLLRLRPAHGLIGAPTELLELIGASVLKLERANTVVIAWADEILGGASAEALESVLAEVPKDAARILVASQVNAGVAQLAERHARRARRIGESADGAGFSIAIRYVSTTPAARLAALRRVLDDLDPESAAIYTRSDTSERELRESLTALGFMDDDPAVRVTRGGPVREASLLVLFELPVSREELRELIGGGSPAVVALVQPRQLTALRALAGEGAVLPLALSGASGRAQDRQMVIRAAIREVLTNGIPAHELLALEQLLEEYDGAEVAAAALRLLEREREQASRRETREPSARRSEPVQPSPKKWRPEDRHRPERERPVRGREPGRTDRGRTGGGRPSHPRSPHEE